MMGANDIATILRQRGLDADTGRWQAALEGVKASEVERYLARPAGRYGFERLLALISPVAQNYLEQMAQAAHKLTVRRFGKCIQMYVPLYVSNYCINSCLYCGYNCANEFERTRLTVEQAVTEADVIAGEGFRHILLLSSEDPEYATVDYFVELAGRLRSKFESISVEIYPMSKDGYARLLAAGIDGVTLYQETYGRDVYAEYHPTGPKSDYDSRLLAHDRTGASGMRRIGLGVLLGLGDWRIDTLALAEHAHYLMKKYWRAQVSFSFPRLRPAVNVAARSKYGVSDREFVQMMLALRLCFGDAGIVLSTRERAELRDNLVRLCVTKISAGSKTNPGGYSVKTGSVEQFAIDDSRSPAEVAAMLEASGIEPVWKDWDKAFSG